MKLGIIGAGNMGTAIIKGYIAAGADASNIIVCGHHPEKLEAMKSELGITIAPDVSSLTDASDAVMVAVKPKDMAKVLAEAAPRLKESQLIISIAAGKSIMAISEMLDSAAVPADKRKIIRVMPNTPAMVGEAMSALCRNEAVSDEEFASVMEIFAGVGKASEITENLMDVVGAVSGCSPAYVYMFIEAMADGGVKSGMPRAQAYEFAAQSVLGAAKTNIDNGYSFIGSLVYGVAAGIGYTLAIVLFASIRERLDATSKCPKCFEGFPISLVAAALLAMSFMGFSGLSIW